MTRLFRLCDVVALTALGLLFAVVAANVIGRALYDYTGQTINLIIPGAIELSRYALMVMVLAALPRAAVIGMVRVDVLVERLPPIVAGALDRLWSLAIAAFGAAAGWLLVEEAIVQVGRGDATQDLELPLWIFTGFAGSALGVLAVTGLWLAIRGRRR